MFFKIKEEPVDIGHNKPVAGKQAVITIYAGCFFVQVSRAYKTIFDCFI